MALPPALPAPPATLGPASLTGLLHSLLTGFLPSPAEPEGPRRRLSQIHPLPLLKTCLHRPYITRIKPEVFTLVT